MKQKILFIHRYFGCFGGAEQNILATSSSLKEHFDLSFLYSQHTGNNEEPFHKNFGASHCVDFTKDKVNTEVLEILRKENPSLIYMHKCLSIPILEAVLESKIPIARMVHDHEVYCLRGSKYFPVSRCICKRKAGLCCIFQGLAFIQRSENGNLRFKWPNYFKHKTLTQLDQQCHSFFVASKYMHEELVRQGYPSESISILPPVPPANLETIPPPSFDKNTIIFAGQIIRGKGLDCLLHALGSVKTEFKLKVLGSGSAQEQCEKLVLKLNLQDKVQFLGFIPHENMASYYQDASIGVVPSVWPEPFGAIGIEFMRHGLPVIGFDSGGISDWLKDNETGYLIPHLDIDEMGRKIEHLLTHRKEAQRLGKNAQEFVNRHFRFEDYFTKMISKFRELILINR